MKLEEAIKELKGILNHIKIANECGVATRGEYHKEKKAIEVISNHLTKQEKMIELTLAFLDCLQLNKDVEGYKVMNKEDWKQYFEKKAEDLIE